MKKQKIIWTATDEAPYLATNFLLPILKKFTKNTEIEFELRDISLAGRIISEFSEFLNDNQKQNNDLKYLGNLVKEKDANIIKLPNISASIAQLKNAIKELQNQGYNLPDYPDEATNEEQIKIKNKYAKVLGSAVNPVLREGNSDRRAALSVKKFAKKHPHKMMKPWEKNSKTHVAYMKKGDFYETEKSLTLKNECKVNIIFTDKSGNTKILKKDLELKNGEIIDSSVMNVKSLCDFYEKEFKDAKEQNLLLSLHLKATMMKISDPVIFGHAVKTFYKDVFEKHNKLFEELGVNPNNALIDIYNKIQNLPDDQKKEIENDINKVYENRPNLAMVDSDKGITNLHATNNIIIDASMPVVIRDGGKMWNANGELQDTKALIPDRCYSRIYQIVIEDCQKNGAFNPAEMGTVSNVGLMAQKAEEYGSHDKTFIAPDNGKIFIIDNSDNILLEQTVEKNDIFRMCQVKDIPIKNWIELAVDRARKTNDPMIFWLDKNRAHDNEIIKKIEKYLSEINTENLNITIKPPEEAMKYSLERIRKGLNTISATGNILRDYLTDLFPILELGTSAKMLSIVPLLNGGGLFETGAGGSAPKHVHQFLKENHLRWDSLGEYCALTSSFEALKTETGNIFAKTLDKAISSFLENKKSPSRKVNELDNRGSSFYLALYWAKELSLQNENKELKNEFFEIYEKLNENEEIIIKELIDVQGQAVDLGGYYHPDENKVLKAMRPSETLNNII